MPTAHQKALAVRNGETVKAIRADVSENLTAQDEYVIEGMASVLFGLESNIAQKVQNPDGLLVGEYFPDAVWSAAIERVHQFPKLLDSVTFAELYKNFLPAATKWNNLTHGAYSAPEFIEELNTEIAGTYILKSRDVPVASAPGPIEVSADAPEAKPESTPTAPSERLEGFVQRTTWTDVPAGGLRPHLSDLIAHSS